MKQVSSNNSWAEIRRKGPQKLLAAVVSLVILFLIYQQIDLAAMIDVLAASNKVWLILSIFMIIPITMLSAVRLRWVATRQYRPSNIDAFRLTVIANALNLFLPAKLGDLAKSHFFHKEQTAPIGVSISIIVYERVCDLFAVCCLCLLGWCAANDEIKLAPLLLLTALAGWILTVSFLCSAKLSDSMFTKFSEIEVVKKRDRLLQLISGWPTHSKALGKASIGLCLYSLALWFLHLVQLWAFTVSVEAEVPFAIGLTLFPFVLLCSMVPFTLAGIGPRDAAIVYFFSAYMSTEAAGAVGLLTITRGIIPSVLALPFLPRFFQTVIHNKSEL